MAHPGRPHRARDGRHERPIVFADDDRPGIMFASAAAAYVERYGVRPGDRAVVFTNNDTDRPGRARRCARPVSRSSPIVDARRERDRGRHRAADGDGRLVVRRDRPRRSMARLRDRRGGPAAGLRRLEPERRACGARPAARSASTSGSPRSSRIGQARTGGWTAVGAPPATSRTSDAIEPAGVVPPPGDAPSRADAWATPLRRPPARCDRRATCAGALGAGLTSIEHVKRYTTIGTGADQGKTSGVAGLRRSPPRLLGRRSARVGVPPTGRRTRRSASPSSPAATAATCSTPSGVTPIHAWHVAHGAVFEDVGQWKRPRYFPRAGEDDGRRRSCASAHAARTGVAVMDATTLGKIDLQGPDAGIFLDRVYTNTFSTLKVGPCRYGVMCRLDGMVFDDGVTTRLADDRFLMTTTTGNAAAGPRPPRGVAPDRVAGSARPGHLVTEQWATVAVVGPRSREVVAALAPGLDVSIEAFPFMTWRDAVIAGIAGRGSSGSRSPASWRTSSMSPSGHGLALWEAVMAAGAPFGITPVRHGGHARPARREGLSDHRPGDRRDRDAARPRAWRAGLHEEGLHRPALAATADTVRPDRKQLVGLLPVDPDDAAPRGRPAGRADADLASIPVPMLGHVTSSYRSAALGRTFALALVKGGRDRIGERVRVPLPDRVVEAVIAESVLFDPENRRRDGEPDGMTAADGPDRGHGPGPGRDAAGVVPGGPGRRRRCWRASARRSPRSRRRRRTP